MNKDQLYSISRSIAIAVIMYGSGAGWFGQDVASQLMALAPVLLAAAWGVSDKTPAAIVSKAANLVWVPESSQINAGIAPDKVKPPPPPPPTSNT